GAAQRRVGDGARRRRGLAGPHLRPPEGAQHPPSGAGAGRRPFAADPAVRGRQRDARGDAHHGGGGRRPALRHMARRAEGRAAHAEQRRRQLHQHALGRRRAPHAAADDRDHARRVRRVQPVPGADGPSDAGRAGSDGHAGAARRPAGGRGAHGGGNAPPRLQHLPPDRDLDRPARPRRQDLREV
ncbi:MAG: Sulfopyruvate decarboxylase - alpha subunit, partial [uncultured Acetobacteraceae bacterium]